jgi:hypothetical protein
VQVNRSYTSNGLNQYSQSGSNAVAHDAKGNLTSIGGDNWSYSQLNALAGIPNGYLFYDPLGRRDYMTKSGVVQWFEYSGNTLVGESDRLILQTCKKATLLIS